MSSRRSFTREFKAGVVEEYVSGRSSVAQLSRRHEISPQLIYRWKKHYAQGELTGANSKEDMALKLRVLELEKLVVELSYSTSLSAIPPCIRRPYRAASPSHITNELRTKPTGSDN